MASGLAVASFDYAAGRQFVRHGENGLAAPCNQPESLVAAATELARNAALRIRLRAAAATALSAQSWDQIIQRFEAELMTAALAAAP